MIETLMVLVGLALATAVPAPAVESARPSTSGPSGKASAEIDQEPAQSEGARRVADWVATSRDNGALPYVIIDKNAATVFLYSAKGKPLGEAPVLIGVAPGDEATPGIGSKNLAEIGPAERTTPAGRFVAKYGYAFGRQRVLWVDYATSVALHTIPPGNRNEKRRERMLSPTADDNRITFGCINVPKAFYRKISPLFAKKGGVVYILPDTKPLEVVFPRLRVQPFLTSREP